MPPLHEGVLLYMPSAPPGMSATEAARVLQRIDAALAAVPEVERVFGKMGRAETATDPAPIGMVETTVTLRPREQWRPGLTWDGLVRELDATLQIPGMPNLWWMPIQTRTEMLATGVRSPIALRILGDDLRSIERAALRIEARMRDVPGTRSAFAERSEGGQFVDVTPDVEACVAAGVTPAQVLSTLETAVGGSTAGELFEGRTRSPIRVRYGRDGRSDLAAVGEVRVGTVPLKQVARIETVEGPPMIRSEGGRLAGYVFIDPGEVAAGTWLEAGRPALAELPADTLRGLDVAWVGQFEHFERAMATLSWTIPLVLGVVLLLLRLATGSWVETTIVALAVPFSAIGAAWLLYALDYHVSLATWVGLIALLGLDAETGLVMLLYLKLAHDERAASGRLQTRSDLRDAIIEGAARRIRPKLMTVMTTFVGLVPVLWSTGTGADVMKRVAAPMVGGLASSFLLELLVYPALYALAKGRTVGVGRVEEPSPE
jgi:Cu(I)/Ag(I) efflux system membrane protein CusA/SilA